MKNVESKIKNYPVYLAIFFLAFSLVACSDDDDDGIVDIDPTGFFEVEEEQELTGNTITLERITVGQDSWLVAVLPSNVNTNNFIAGPVMLEEGPNNDVELTFDEGVIEDDGTGQQVVLKLYAENMNGGTSGEWDETDEPVTAENNIPVTETIVVFEETTGGTAFASFDTNNNGTLESTEVPAIYENNFDEWDANDDNVLDIDEFNATAFSLTDMDDDDGIDADEWDEGFNSFFGNWNEDDFAAFDADSSGDLDLDEWNEAFADSAWFDSFDLDDNDGVAEDEWDAGLFDDWDVDDNDLIDEDEFNIFSPFAMNW